MIVTVVKDVSQDHVLEMKMEEVRKRQMVSADNKTTTSSADHGHKVAAAAIVGGVETPKLTAVLAASLDYAVATAVDRRHQMANVASRTTMLYVVYGRLEAAVAAVAGVETVPRIAVLDVSLDLVLTVFQIQQHRQAKRPS